MIAIVGLTLIGPFGLYSWCIQTYMDSSSASLWRRMSTSPQALGKNRTLVKPLVSLLFILEGVGMLGENGDPIDLDEERSDQPK